MKSSVIQSKAKVMNGVSVGVVKLSAGSDVLSWANGEVIIQAPIGKMAVDFLIEKAAVDSKYAQVVHEIAEQAKYHVPKEHKQEVFVSPTQALEGKSEYQIMYEKLKDAKILKHQGIKVVVDDKEWPTYKNFVKDLEENDELMVDMRKRLRAVQA
jgi:hypothetical protein